MFFKVILPLVLCLVSYSNCQTCEQSVLDMVIVIDSSGSIGAGAFQEARNAIEQMIDNLDIGPKKVKVGIINYSSGVSTVSTLLESQQDKRVLKGLIRNLPYQGGMTATGDALGRANQIFFANPRQFTPRVVVLFTDGGSNSGSSVYTQADLLKSSKVEIFVVGIGSGINHNEIDRVSSIPLSTYKKVIANYNELFAAINDITRVACDTPVFIDIKQVVQVPDVTKNAVRLFQVDVSKTAKAASFYEVKLKTITGLCLIEEYSWLTSAAKLMQSESRLLNSSKSFDSKAVSYFLEKPANALRLYVKVKCLDDSNSYEMLIDSF